MSMRPSEVSNTTGNRAASLDWHLGLLRHNIVFLDSKDHDEFM